MNKRTFLATVAVTGLLPATVSHAAATSTAGPALLTLSGAIGKANRGPLDRLRDQMMVKHRIKFDKAFVFDAAALRQLPAVTIKPTLEYDAKASRRIWMASRWDSEGSDRNGLSTTPTESRPSRTSRSSSASRCVPGASTTSA